MRPSALIWTHHTSRVTQRCQLTFRTDDTSGVSFGQSSRQGRPATVKAVAPKPINFLNSGAFGYTVSDLAAMGVRRISVGGTLSRVAMHAFVQSSRQLAEGKFDSFAGIISNAELNKFFHEDLPSRPRT